MEFLEQKKSAHTFVKLKKTSSFQLTQGAPTLEPGTARWRHGRARRRHWTRCPRWALCHNRTRRRRRCCRRLIAAQAQVDQIG